MKAISLLCNDSGIFKTWLFALALHADGIWKVDIIIIAKPKATSYYPQYNKIVKIT